jgi:hypothetical protein
MKIRRTVLWLGAAAAVLLVLVVWFARQPAGTPVSSQPAADVPAETVERKPAVAPGGHEPVPAPPSHTNVGSPAISSAATASTPRQSKEEQAKEALSMLNDVPIDFYGKLQDQFADPVAGAEITGSIIYDNGSSNGVREIKTVSDANGLFEIHGGKGESLSVMPRKEGYALAATTAGFRYSHFYPESRHVPNPPQPAVIEMWKLQGAERLIHFQTKAYVRLDGTPSTFDLQTGKRAESGGDITLVVESPAVPDPMQQYAWKAKIRSEGGGLILWQDVGFEKMFVAPESGYEREIVIVQSGVKPWSSRFNGTFYLRSRNGAAYGKLSVAIITDVVKHESIPVIVSGYMNPAASRNLEVDSARVTEATP